MNVACRHHFAHATASGGACSGAAISEGARATAAVSRGACSTLHRRVSHWRPARGGYTWTERRDALLGTATGGLSWSRRLRLVRGRDDDRRWEHERLRSGLTTGLAALIRVERRRGRGIRLRRSQADRARLDCPAGAGGGIGIVDPERYGYAGDADRTCGVYLHLDRLAGCAEYIPPFTTCQVRDHLRAGRRRARPGARTYGPDHQSAQSTGASPRVRVSDRNVRT